MTIYPTVLRMMVSIILLITATLGFACASSHRTSGCGKFHEDIGESHAVTIPQTLANGSEVYRQFLVHLPLSYDKHTASALVLSYHGRGKTMREQERISGLSEATLNPNMISVYPQGFNVGLLNSWHLSSS